MNKYKGRAILFIMIFIVIMAACHESYTPKPTGYLRVNYPEKKYREFDTTAPFAFEYPAYARIVPDTAKKAEPWWYNMNFPSLNATLYLSYKPVKHNLQDLIEDSRTLTYKHTIKAEAIDESLIRNDSSHVYGILYDLKGNTASSVQFFTTDSTTHFLRGSLYFNSEPNKDSLAPVIKFIRQDVEHMINTLHWK
jgi:gliding motility-associated lipoprotein GldD